MYNSNSRSSSSESYEEENRLDIIMDDLVLNDLFQKLLTRTYRPYQKIKKPTLPNGTNLSKRYITI